MNSYRLTQQVELKEINSILREWIHEKSGARVMQLENDDPENLFCLSFKTLPSTSNGVAHILEHTVLCGSEKYPVKDPFFSMTRRSLHTYMNALTGHDFTCYPAATQVPKDFYNLLDVYLNAVFYPKLDHLSFLQEAVRLEYDEEGKLKFKGIVYNEMKGAMGSGFSRLHELLLETLFPDVTYGINSGGDPKDIPSLTYEELKSFHKTYYHPSNCIFFFYGNLPYQKHLQFIEENVLANVEKAEPIKDQPLQPSFKAPKHIQGSYPVAADEPVEGKTLIGMGWVTAPIDHLLDTLGLTILTVALLDTDASPLKQKILKSGLATQVLVSIDNEMNQVPIFMTFIGTEASKEEALEKLIFDSLKEIASTGIDKEHIENAIHQSEMGRLEITGGSHPYGLNLFFRSALFRQHNIDPVEGLKVLSLYDSLRKTLEQNPKYFSELIEKYFINNPHFASVVMVPDPLLQEKEKQEEDKKLKEIESTLTEEGKKNIQDLTKALKTFQKRQENQNEGVLPKVTLEDVAKNVQTFPLTQEGNLFQHATFTNGLIYTDLVFELPFLSEEEIPYFRLMNVVLTQMGTQNASYERVLHDLHAYTGGISPSCTLQNLATDNQALIPTFNLLGKGLSRDMEHLFRLTHDFVTCPDFFNLDRLKEILLKHKSSLEGSFNQAAMKYASNLSQSDLSTAGYFSLKYLGLDYFLFARDKLLTQDIQEIAKKIKEIHQKVVTFRPPQLVLGSDQDSLAKAKALNYGGLINLKTEMNPLSNWEYTLSPIVSQGRAIASGVAFIARSFKTIPYNHPDAPLLSLFVFLADTLFLHPLIREEGGAYGGGVSCNSLAGTITFHSYRDPHISSTLDAFEASIKGIEEGKFSSQDLEEAKLEFIQVMDHPVSPGSRADTGYSWYREQKTTELREKFRLRALQATKKEIQEAVKKHISPHYPESKSVIFAGQNLLKEMDGKIEVLPI